MTSTRFSSAALTTLRRHRAPRSTGRVGAFCSTPLAFIYPPLLHLKLAPTQTWATWLANVGLGSVGMGAMVFCGSQVIAGWDESGSAQ